MLSDCWISGCIWPRITLKKYEAKKYQKMHFVSIPWRILRSKPAILPKSRDHVLTGSFFFNLSLLFLQQDCQQSVNTCKSGLNILNVFYLQK